MRRKGPEWVEGPWRIKRMYDGWDIEYGFMRVLDNCPHEYLVALHRLIAQIEPCSDDQCACYEAGYERAEEAAPRRQP